MHSGIDKMKHIIILSYLIIVPGALSVIYKFIVGDIPAELFTGLISTIIGIVAGGEYALRLPGNNKDDTTTNTTTDTSSSVDDSTESSKDVSNLPRIT